MSVRADVTDGKAQKPLDIYHPVKTKDGWVIGHVGSNAHFLAACRTFGREDLLEDSRFATPWLRTSQFPAMWAELGRDAVSSTTRELVDASARHGMPLAPVLDLNGFFADPQVRHNGTYIDHEDPEYGVLRQLKYPVDFGVSPATSQGRAPRLSEHAEEILENLGLPSATVADYRRRRIIA